MEIQRHALVKRDYLVPFVLVTSLFFLWGFAHAILDVLNKHFQEVMDITRTHSAMVQVMFYLGYFIMAIPAGLFITKYGYRKGVVFGLLLYGIGSLMFIPGEYWMSFEFFLFSLFVIACGLVFLETAANPYMTELGDRETAASRLNLAQSFNGLGCICGPLVGGLLLFSGKGEANISYPYMLMEVLTGQTDIKQAALQLAEWGVKEVLITLGSLGSIIYAEGTFHKIPAYPPKDIVDATGCGDTYATGYLYMRNKGASYEEAGCFAAAMSTLKLEASGPFSKTEEDVWNIIRTSSLKAEKI